ncbi:MAG TPA: glycosyltransferase family 2 protein [Caulobacteraceae bacterium]
MNAPVQEWVLDNAAWAAARARLSVLIPFLNDDPRRLIAALDTEASVLGGAVELVLLDDGAGDDELARNVGAAIEALALPSRLVQLPKNEGRSKGRNRLARHARSARLLFLDSDMLPDAPDFLRRYLELLRAEDPPVAFGGFSLKQAPEHPEHRLHRRMASRSDCAPAKRRRKAPAKYVFTSNLLIRRDVFETERFDEGFTGWGWEDVEWGVRVARKHPILHLDNPATHLGLDPARIIAMKYEQSAANFARLLRSHPDIVRRYPTYRLARLMKLMPLPGLWRPVLKAIALAELAPLRLRAFCMRLYRVAVTAQAI